MVIVRCADVHKETHSAVGADQAARVLGQIKVPATTAGHDRVLPGARNGFADQERVWGVEDCRHLSARLEADLLTGGETVVRVYPKLRARARASARTLGKSAPVDALAVGRSVLRESDLPRACHDGASRELKLLVDRREDLLGEWTRAVNRLRCHLHELDRAADLAPKGLESAVVRNGLLDRMARREGLVAELALELMADIYRLTGRINDLQRRISRLAEAVCCLQRQLAKLVYKTLTTPAAQASASLPAAA